MDDDALADDRPQHCDVCGRDLLVVPERAGRHLAVRLDCPAHGARLMWTPFGDDAQ